MPNIRPVQFDDKNILRFVDPQKPNIAYLWNTKWEEEAKLSPLETLSMRFTFAYQGFFKPTFKEVLMQIPDALWSKVRGAEIIPGEYTFETVGDKTYHVAQVRLYQDANAASA
jgi:hypothetical protein